MPHRRASLKRLYLRATAASQAALGLLFFAVPPQGSGARHVLAYATLLHLVAAPLMFLFTLPRFERYDFAFGLLFASTGGRALAILTEFLLSGARQLPLLNGVAFLVFYLAAHWTVARVPEIHTPGG